MEQYTVAIIKWNVVKAVDISKYGFKVDYEIRAHVKDLEWWAEFYSEHKGKDYFESLVKYMATGTCHFMILTHSQGDPIKRWRDAIGPTNAAMTKEPPTCLRAIYGDDESLRTNGFHGSDSTQAAEREAKLIKQL